MAVAIGVLFCTAPVALASPGLSDPAKKPVLEYLQFFHRWDTPTDDRAAELFSRVVKSAPTWPELQRLLPAGSESRALFERHLASFEEAAGLIRSGRMSEDLFFDAWYALPGSWTKAKAFVIGLRKESGHPELYGGLEWLASRAEAFLAERGNKPPLWHPIAGRAPSPDDVEIFEAFSLIWATPRDAAGREYLASLEKRAPKPDEFIDLVPLGSEAYTKFDRVLCAYDQAGALIKSGFLHPDLFLGSWRSPTEIWTSAGPWVRALRASTHSAHLYDNVDWLVDFEREWRLSRR